MSVGTAAPYPSALIRMHTEVCSKEQRLEEEGGLGVIPFLSLDMIQYYGNGIIFITVIGLTLQSTLLFAFTQNILSQPIPDTVYNIVFIFSQQNQLSCFFMCIKLQGKVVLH